MMEINMDIMEALTKATIVKRNIEKHINDYQIIINPCPMCNHYNKENYAEVCSSCSYFYASNFELKH